MKANGDFIPFPAIDLRRGQVVRLKEGDPRRETRYSNDPAAVALKWIDAGARWLHVVNLDGAFEQPDSANRQALQSILNEVKQQSVHVQFGGGLRSLAAIAAALDAGVSRVILGTLAIEQPEALAAAIARWGAERVGASLDAREGRVQVRGWLSAGAFSALEAAQALKAKGLRWLVFTDIARDGLQTGLNLPATVALARATGMSVIASGGIAGLEDVHAAREAGLAGAIVGRALYEGSIDPKNLFRP